MARYRPIDVDIWLSPTFQNYDALQHAVFFYYHTRKEATESGIYRISPRHDALLFKLPGESEHISPELLVTTIRSMPENLRFDDSRNLIFAVQFLRHNGLKRGRPSLIANSIARDFSDYPDSPLWDIFNTEYPFFNETICNLRQTFANTLLKLKPTFGISEPSTEQSDKAPLQNSQTLPKVSGKFQETFCLVECLVECIKEKGGVGERENINHLPASTEPNSRPLTHPSNSLTSSTPQLPWVSSEELRLAFDAFLKNLVANGRVPTKESAILLGDELQGLSKGSLPRALSILRFSTKRAYRRLVVPDDENSGPMSPDDSKAILTRLTSASAWGSKFTEALTAFAGPLSVAPADVLSNPSHAQAFKQWLIDYFPAGRNPEIPLRLMDHLAPIQITQLLEFMPEISTAYIDEKLALPQAKDNSTFLFKALAYDYTPSSIPQTATSEDPFSSFPLYGKAATTGLTKEERASLPFKFIDRLQPAPDANGLFHLKTR